MDVTRESGFSTLPKYSVCAEYHNSRPHRNYLLRPPPNVSGGHPRNGGVVAMVAKDMPKGAESKEGASADMVSLIDKRTKVEYEIPIENDTISAMALRQIKVNEDDFGMMSYDPAFKNTASTKSTITYLDGEGGVLRYRGYPIEQLAKKSTFLETALPDPLRRAAHQGAAG